MLLIMWKWVNSRHGMSGSWSILGQVFWSKCLVGFAIHPFIKVFIYYLYSFKPLNPSSWLKTSCVTHIEYFVRAWWHYSSSVGLMITSCVHRCYEPQSHNWGSQTSVNKNNSYNAHTNTNINLLSCPTNIWNRQMMEYFVREDEILAFICSIHEISLRLCFHKHHCHMFPKQGCVETTSRASRKPSALTHWSACQASPGRCLRKQRPGEAGGDFGGAVTDTQPVWALQLGKAHWDSLLPSAPQSRGPRGITQS